MSKWLVCTKNFRGFFQNQHEWCDIYYFVGEIPSEDEVKKITDERGIITFMQRLSND